MVNFEKITWFTRNGKISFFLLWVGPRVVGPRAGQPGRGKIDEARWSHREERRGRSEPLGSYGEADGVASGPI